MPTRRGRDLRILYDSDFGVQRTIAQRTYRDENDVALTPVTPLLTARLIVGVPVDRSRLRPRYGLCCVPNPGNQGGKSDLKVVSPYLPGTSVLKDHIRELLAHDNGVYQVASVTFFSEGLS